MIDTLLRNTPGAGIWACKMQIEMHFEMRLELSVGAPKKRLRAANFWDSKGQPGEWTLRKTAGAKDLGR